jgi:hypothetical protein
VDLARGRWCAIALCCRLLPIRPCLWLTSVTGSKPLRQAGLLHEPGPSLAAVMGEEGAPIPTGVGDKDALEDGPWTEGPGEPREPIFEDGGALLLVVVSLQLQA